MAIPTRLTDFSTTAASNFPAGSETVFPNLDDYLRAFQAVVRGDLAFKGADIASASTTDLGAVQGSSHTITGTTTITSFGTVSAGIWKMLTFSGILTLTNNGTSLILPGAANITTAAGDTCLAESLGSGNWRVHYYIRINGSPIAPFIDTNPIVVGSGDATKKVRFEVDGLTTATTRVLTVQDSDDTLVGRATTDTLTNKTLTAAVLGGTTDVSGGQLKFPAAQSASADANTLDDYEEGTWTPTISGSVTAGTQTYSNQTGRYTKIGRLVFCEFRVTMTAKDATTSGIMRVSGLPFTVGALIGGLAVGVCANVDFTAGFTQFAAIPIGGGTALSCTQIADNAALTDLQAAAISATTDVAGSVFYSV
jgi:hypothetical protein